MENDEGRRWSLVIIKLTHLYSWSEGDERVEEICKDENSIELMEKALLLNVYDAIMRYCGWF
jgi:hypothetical protein